MTDESGAVYVVTAVILIILAIALGAVVYVRRRRHSLDRSAESIPLIVFPDAGVSGQFPARPDLHADAWIPATPPGAHATPRVTSRDLVDERDAPVARDFAPPPPPPSAAPRTARSTVPTSERAPRADDLDDDDGSVIATETPAPRVVHPVADLIDERAATASPTAPHSNGTARPADGTLQFLPGRLEILEGQDAGQEIRFVRTGERTEITFGRSEGPLYRHVQLREQTVSRVHARLSREGSQWRLTNLSATNPLHVNGAPLDPTRASVMLADGDRIEMGEVVLRYRGH
ncbi:MAG TPA: FHA domain-containing protein [Gemmatimonadaceae bacterium]|nr:FHA domain-containing protein [Gemmatimonadaceae bacterium]